MVEISKEASGGNQAKNQGENPVQLSLVIPIYNEIENLLPLHASIVRALADQVSSYEILYVDDGSTDGSRSLLHEMALQDPRIQVVELRSNFGQTAAMSAGFDFCRGEFVITMDGDLQNDPADIPVLLREMEKGFDVVCGWRKDRQDRAFSRKFPSWVANRLISSLTDVSIHDTGCTLKAYRSWVVKRLHLYSDMHRFIPALASGAGARVTELPVRHHPRLYGTSKYGISRILKVLTDLMVVRMIARFVAHPVRYFGVASLPFWGASFFFALLGLFKFEREGGIHLLVRWDLSYMTASLVIGITALNLFLLGLLAELSVHVSGYFTRVGIEPIETRRGTREASNGSEA